MKKEEFIKVLSEISDFELYSLAKSKLITSLQTNNFNDWRLKCIFDECSNRNLKIYNDALCDAIYSIHSQNFQNKFTRNINRIDHLSISELKITLDELLERNNKMTTKIGFEELMNSITGVLKNQDISIFRVAGNSMEDAGIFDNAIIIVKEHSIPKDGEIVLVKHNGRMLVKTLKILEENLLLKSKNSKYPDIVLDQYSDCEFLGVVKLVVNAT
ncbi:MAG TPA: S24 family peptidase [Candidatus Kapabacteria bacterium]|nr:S24 family peptidase [Candidatus Kapabacteria bacterium]HPO61825.1 S24 family peptidase [Candidatus Kapabacteria bacterium]